MQTIKNIFQFIGTVLFLGFLLMIMPFVVIILLIHNKFNK